jgi:hypothetical protein
MVGLRGSGRSDYTHRITSVYIVERIRRLYPYSILLLQSRSATLLLLLILLLLLMLLRLLPLPSYSYTYTAIPTQVRRRSQSCSPARLPCGPRGTIFEQRETIAAS